MYVPLNVLCRRVSRADSSSNRRDGTTENLVSNNLFFSFLIIFLREFIFSACRRTSHPVRMVHAAPNLVDFAFLFIYPFPTNLYDLLLQCFNVKKFILFALMFAP